MRKIKISQKNGSAGAVAAAVLMLFAAAARVAAYWDVIPAGTRGSSFLYLQFILPLACNVFFAIFVLAFGKKAMWPTILPVIMGCIFFIARITDPANNVAVGTWHIALCCCLYTLVGVMYTLTVTGVIRAKWPLVLVFGLPLLYHIIEGIYKTVAINGGVLTMAFNLPEISVLLIMTSLFVTACSLKN